MKSDQIIDAIDATLIHLAWLQADRYAGALRLLAHVAVPRDDGPSTGGGPSIHGTGSHSDPTGDAVCSSADRQAQLSDRAHTIAQTSRWLRTSTFAPQLGPGPGTLQAAQLDLEWLLVVPHRITAWRPPTDEHRRELHHAIDLVHLEASALQLDVEKALKYSATVKAGVPKAKPRRWCIGCARAGRQVDIYVDRYADLCRSCGDYKAATRNVEHPKGRLPPVPYCEYVYQRGRKPPAELERRWLHEETIPSKQARKRNA